MNLPFRLPNSQNQDRTPRAAKIPRPKREDALYKRNFRTPEIDQEIEHQEEILSTTLVVGLKKTYRKNTENKQEMLKCQNNISEVTKTLRHLNKLDSWSVQSTEG